MNLIKLLLIGLTMTALTACSKTVQWEEEVLLNTGETILVKRSVPWELQGGTGNPVDLGMRPSLSKQVFQFSYAGIAYKYAGGADIRWIAISPSKTPILLAESASFGWDVRNNYFCVTPQYVQFIPQAGGEQWTWPERIDAWLYNLPANLMANIPKLEEKLIPRYSARDRDQRDATYRLQSPGGARIEPTYKTTCITNPAGYVNQNRTTK